MILRWCFIVWTTLASFMSAAVVVDVIHETATQTDVILDTAATSDATVEMRSYFATQQRAERITLLIGEERHFDCTPPKTRFHESNLMPADSSTLAWFRLARPDDVTSNRYSGGAERIPDLSFSHITNPRHILPQNNTIDHATTFVEDGLLHFQPVTSSIDGTYICEALSPTPTFVRALHLTTHQSRAAITALRIGATFAVLAWNTTTPNANTNTAAGGRRQAASSWLNARHRITQAAQLHYRLLLSPAQLERKFHRRHNPNLWHYERQIEGITHELHPHERGVTLRDLLPDAEYEVCLRYRRTRHTIDGRGRRLLCCLVFHTQHEDLAGVSGVFSDVQAHADLLHFLLIMSLLLMFIMASCMCLYRIVFGLRRYGRHKTKIFPAVEEEALLFQQRKYYSAPRKYSTDKLPLEKTSVRGPRQRHMQPVDDEYWLVATTNARGGGGGKPLSVTKKRYEYPVTNYYGSIATQNSTEKPFLEGENSGSNTRDRAFTAKSKSGKPTTRLKKSQKCTSSRSSVAPQCQPLEMITIKI